MNPATQLHIAPTKAEKIDRFGDLYWQLEKIKPEFDSLRAEIGGWYEGTPGESAAQAAGLRYTVMLTARENRRKITDKMKAFTLLRKRLGLAPLIELLTIPFKEAVDKHIPVAQHGLFVVQARTGPRTLTPIPNAEAKAA